MSKVGRVNAAHASPSLARAMAWFGAAYGFTIFAYLVLNAAAVRFLGPESFGYFVTAVTLTGVLGQVGLMGVHRSGLREAARLGRDDEEQLATLRAGVRSVTLLSLPAVGVATSVVTWFVLGSQSTANRWAMTLAMGALVVLSGLQRLWADYLRGFGRLRLASMMEGRSGGALVGMVQALLVILVWIVAPNSGLPGALAAVALGYAIPVAFASRAVRQHWGHVQGKTQIISDLRQVIRRDWKFASVQVATLLNASIDLWVATALLSSVDNSMFGAAQRLSLIVLLPMTAMRIVFAPTISRLAAGGSPGTLERLLRTAASLATGLTLLLCLPLIIAPSLVMRIIFGPGFGAAIAPFLLLASALIVNAAMGLSGLTLSMAHREGVNAKVQWVGLVLRVVLDAALAAAWGLNALAFGSALVSSAMFVAMWWAARRRLGVNTAATARPQLALIRQTGG